MDITAFVDTLRTDLARAAEAVGPDAASATERVGVALEPSFRMAAFELLSEATAEITSQLPVGSVEIRLRGRDPQIVVDVPASTPSHVPSYDAASPETQAAEDDTLARISLRLPESLKARADEAAERAGISLNAWLVGVIRGATTGYGAYGQPPMPPVPPMPPIPPMPPTGRGRSRRMTGWV